MEKNKKSIRLCIFVIILMLIPIIKVYGNETDKYTCNKDYEKKNYDGDIACCPTGFEYGVKEEISNDKICYKETQEPRECGNMELYDKSNGYYYCYTEPSKAGLEENYSGCYSCKNHNKYIFSKNVPTEGCPTEWVASDLNEQECKLKENNNTTNNDSEDGIYMVLQCGNDVAFFATYFTDNSGNIFKSIYRREQHEDWVYHKLTPTCWLSDSEKEISDAECTNDEDIYSIENKNIFLKGICPVNVRASNRIDESYYVPYGQSEPIKKAKLTNNKFIIYSYDYDGETKIIVEAYSYKSGITRGKYGYIGGDLVNGSYDEILYQQSKILEYLYRTDGSIDFFNIDNKFATLQIAGKGNDDSDIAVCEGIDIETCKNNKNFKVLLISGDGKAYNAENVTIDKKVSAFFENDGVNGIRDIKQVFEKNDDYKNVLNDEEFINACKVLNQEMNKNGIYKFSDYSLEEMINKLENATNLINELYKKSDDIFGGKELLTATAEWIMNDTIGTKELLDLTFKKGEEYSLNATNKGGAVYTAFIELIRDSLEGKTEANMYGINLLSLQSDLDNYGGLFYETVNNLLSGQIELTIGQENRLNSIKDILDIIAEERNYTFAVVNCEGLLSQKLIDKINSYLNIVKYAIPILLIGLGTFDFTKALFAGDEDNMKKAQKTFIKRLSVAILFFFVPIIVNFILGLANKVWPIIIPNSCESKLKDK